MLDEFCPDCGTHRVALFRWCRECGLDFDDLDERGVLPLGPYSLGASAAGLTARAAVTPVTSPSGEPLTPGSPTRGADSIGQPPGTSTRSGPGGVAMLRRRSVRRPISRSIAVGVAAVLAVTILGGLAYAADLAGVQTAVASFASDAAAGVLPAPRAIPSSDPGPTPEPSFGPTGPRTEAAVERVVDGDTIVVRSGGVELYVRYLGVDAPEAVRLDSPVQFMAPEATQANAQLVSGQTVILERDVSDTDGFGRLLRHVWVDRGGTVFLVGLELVKAGFARDTPAAPDTKYQALYADAQAQAQAAGLGIWGTPPSAAPDATLPPSGPTPSARLISNDPATIDSLPTTFRGGAGAYTWRAVELTVDGIRAVWIADAPAGSSCTVDWVLTPATADPVGGTIAVDRKGHAKGTANLPTPFRESLLTVESSCPTWTLTIQGTDR